MSVQLRHLIISQSRQSNKQQKNIEVTENQNGLEVIDKDQVAANNDNSIFHQDHSIFKGNQSILYQDQVTVEICAKQCDEVSSEKIDKRLIKRDSLKSNPSNIIPPKGDIIIFILSYDDETYLKAKSYEYEWAFPILVPGSNVNNPLFENIVFEKYESILSPFILSRHKYIGLLSWKAKHKININTLDNQIKLKQYTKSSFIHFNQGPIQIYRCHPFLKTIWDDIFAEKLGPIEKNKFGYCNYFVARKDIFEKYVKEMQRYIPIVLAHPKSFHDARYPGGLPKEKLMKICGKPWYPHVPFVFERTNLALLKNVSS